jgi:hypothetical protein
MKTSREYGGYTVTGYTAKGHLVQYSVYKNGSGWAVDLTYGQGVRLHMLYSTKAEAVKAIEAQ